MEEFTHIFLLLEVKVSFLKRQKKYIFPTYFAKRNLRSHSLCKFLKALANKIYDVKWGWKISTWRTQHSNYLPKSHHGCNLRCIWLYEPLQKYPRVEFFIGSLLQMPKANDFERDECRTFIVQFPCRKMKTFLFARVIAEKASSSKTLRCGTLYLFPYSGNP